MALDRTTANERFDLSDHMPFGPPDGFEEDGYLFKAWQPASDKARHVAVIQAYKDDSLKDEVVVQMYHPSLFGVDIEDVQHIEEATEQLIQELP